MNFLRDHPYLIESLLLFGLALATMALLPAHRRSLAMAGVLIIPGSAFAPISVPEFWNPHTLLGLPLGIEDLLWTSSSGMLVWFLAVLPFRRRIGQPGPLPTAMFRMALCYLVCGAAFSTLGWLGARWLGPPSSPLPAMTTIIVATGLWLVARQPAMLPLALAGSAGYAVFHTADVLAGILVWPHFKSAWNPAAQLPFELLGVPGWEVVWGAAFGFTWPLLLCFAAGIKLGPAPARRSC